MANGQTNGQTDGRSDFIMPQILFGGITNFIWGHNNKTDNLHANFHCLVEPNSFKVATLLGFMLN